MAIEKLEVISEVVSGVRSEVRVKVGTNLLFRLIRNDRSWVINEIESLGREK